MSIKETGMETKQVSPGAEAHMHTCACVYTCVCVCVRVCVGSWAQTVLLALLSQLGRLEEP